MAFPITRLRRLRRTATLRRMVRETRLAPDDFIQPLFVCPGRDVRKPIESMPGVAQLSVDLAVREARATFDAGVPAVILFGIPARKDATGSEAWSDSGVVQTAIREIKEHVPDLAVITDVCLCEYTDHGHCGVIEGGDVDNDATLELLHLIRRMCATLVQRTQSAIQMRQVVRNFVSQPSALGSDQPNDDLAVELQLYTNLSALGPSVVRGVAR